MPRALILRNTEGAVALSVESISAGDLPEGDVLLSVLYSSLNYKDGLAVTGRGKIIRAAYPFIPGIDLVGQVEESRTERFTAGDLVIGTGWGLGETHWGGYAQFQRVSGSWLVPLPQNLSPEQAMVVGTAGLTAMLAVMALEVQSAAPDRGEMIVTGASGGVGSIAVALLAAAGYSVVASTGSHEANDYLMQLGASRVIGREDLGNGPRRPMDSTRWAGGVDVVGGSTLATIISQLEPHASVASCGLTGGHEFNTTVFPFILRGVNLLGVNSNTCPNSIRQRAWTRLAETLSDELYDLIKAATITLDQIAEYSERILAGDVRGRVVVDVNR